MSKSCSIFVGNVPYDAQEDELKDLFSKAGAVSSIRLVVDKDTRQPKGYAFVDFAEKGSVQTALDTLNNAEYNGRRLRVDTAERELGNSRLRLEDGGGRPSNQREIVSGPTGPALPGPDELPALPVVTVADRLARIREHEAAEEASKTAIEKAELSQLARFVETLTPMQLFQIHGEMQRLSLRAPDVARALLTENTQLCLALQHSQFLLGFAEEAPLPTDPEVREQARNVKQKVFGNALDVIPGVGAAMPGMPGLPPGMPGMLGAGTLNPAFAQAQQQLGAMAAALAAGGLTAMPSPPAAPMPTMPTMPAAAPPAVAGTENKQDLLEKLSKLSPAQIDQLPHATKIALLGFLQTMPAQAAAPAAP